MIRELILRNVEKLAKYFAGPDCGEDTVGHMIDESADDTVAKLASGELVHSDAVPSLSCVVKA